MKRLALLIAVFVVGCNGQPVRRVVWRQAAATAEHQEWLLGCIEKGNPMSDEEGEDLVKQCEQTAYRLFAPKLTRRCEVNEPDDGIAGWEEIPCSEWEPALTHSRAEAGQ